jgi:hypothetical protein
MAASRIERTPVAELITAECTVVERTADQTKNATQHVAAHAVHFVGFTEFRQIAIMAERALAPALEDGDDRSIEVQIGAAAGAVE